jgi:hypothetical protein
MQKMSATSWKFSNLNFILADGGYGRSPNTP